MLALFPRRARLRAATTRLRRTFAGRRTVALVTVALVGGGLAAVPFADGASAATQNCSYATAGTGTFASSLCWLDLTGYSPSAAAASGGQAMSLLLAGGDKLTFTAHASGVSATPTALPTYSGSYLGNSAHYTGVTGKPALYQTGGGSSTVSLQNIAVTDPNGNAVTDFALVSADAETTDSGESIIWNSNVSLASFGSLGNDCGGGLSGSGTSTVTCSGGSGSGSKTGAAFLAAQDPTTVSQTFVGSGLQGVSFAVLTATAQVTSTVSRRITTNDVFQSSLSSAGNSTLAAASTGATGTAASTGPVTVLAGLTGSEYSFADAVTTGVLSNYTQSWSCTRNGLNDPTLPTGAASSTAPVSFNAGDVVACTVTNTPKTVALTTVAESGTPLDLNGDGLTDAGDMIPYTFAVTNTGQLPLTGVAVTSANGGNVDCATTTLAVGASETCTAESYYTVTLAEQNSGDVVDTASAVGTASGTTTTVASPVSTVNTATTIPVPAYTVASVATVASAVRGGVVGYVVTIKNTGNVPYQPSNPATVTGDLSGVLDDAVYNADATDGAVVTGDTLAWSGALAVGATATVAYSVTVHNPDLGDQLLNTVVAPAASNAGACVPGACATSVGVSAFTLSTATADATARPGQSVPFTVTITNTGTVAYTAASPAIVSDNLTGVLDDATFDNDATDGAVLSGGELNWSGALAVGATETITFSATVDANDAGNHELAGIVTPAAGNGGSCATGACATQTDIQSFSLRKAASVGSAIPGQNVRYTVTITNTGTVPYTASAPATFTDNLAAVLDDATYAGDATAGATVSGNVLTWSGPLAVGATETVSYSATVDAADSGDHILTTSVSSAANSGGDCVVGAGSTGCATSTPVASFSVVKTAHASSFDPGSVVAYTVTVTNTGAVDYTAAGPASFTDDLSAVLDDATFNNDASTGATYSAPTISWSGALAVGATATITYSVTVNTPDTGDHVLGNTVVTPINSGGDCATGSSNVGCTSDVAGPVLRAVATASAPAVAPGGLVTYTITLTNTGAAPFTSSDPAVVSDDLSGILDDAVFTGNASNGATLTGHTLNWSGPLAAGASTTITYSVIAATTDSGDHSLRDALTVPSTISSNCAVGAQDAQCAAVAGASSYTVQLSTDSAGARVGNRVAYSVTVTNTGQAAFSGSSPATFSADLSGALDDATFQGGSAGLSLTGTTVNWAGSLGVGASTVVTFSVIVNTPDIGNHVLTATATTNPAIGGSCVSAAGCAATTAIATYSVTKTVSTTQTVFPGDVVYYTIRVTNTGTAAFTSAAPATFTDDLSDVLRFSSYNGDASAGASVTGSILSWSRALPVGQSVDITYAVTISAKAVDGVMHNTVVTPIDSGANCAAGSGAPQCSTATTVDPPAVASVQSASTTRTSASSTVRVSPAIPGLASTGSNVSGWPLIIAILMLGSGLLLLCARSIRRGRRYN